MSVCARARERVHLRYSPCLQVWDANLLSDYHLGSLTLPMTRSEEYTGGNIIRRYSMTKPNNDGKEEHSGYIWLTVKHTTNMLEV